MHVFLVIHMFDPNSQSSDILSGGPVKYILRPGNLVKTCSNLYIPYITCVAI
jgi:hypothetical protein